MDENKKASAECRGKITIVINGKASTGKDTICNIVSNYYNTVNVSAITPIKSIALQNGWNGEKDNKARKFLSDLKRVFAEYNNLSNKYLVDEHRKFMNNDKDVMFVHIRERDQIDLFLNSIKGNCVTLLIRRQRGTSQSLLGNESDDCADGYPYDYCYDNNLPLEKLDYDFMRFFNAILKNKNLTK